jgi:C4-type Zn-finger protein
MSKAYFTSFDPVIRAYDLEPCPFCGNDILFIEEDYLGKNNVEISIVCKKCNFTSSYTMNCSNGESSDERIRITISKWNRREKSSKHDIKLFNKIKEYINR